MGFTVNTSVLLRTLGRTVLTNVRSVPSTRRPHVIASQANAFAPLVTMDTVARTTVPRDGMVLRVV